MATLSIAPTTLGHPTASLCMGWGHLVLPALTTPLPEVKSLSGQLFPVLTFHIQLCNAPPLIWCYSTGSPEHRASCSHSSITSCTRGSNPIVSTSLLHTFWPHQDRGTMDVVRRRSRGCRGWNFIARAVIPMSCVIDGRMSGGVAGCVVALGADGFDLLDGRILVSVSNAE